MNPTDRAFLPQVRSSSCSTAKPGVYPDTSLRGAALAADKPEMYKAPAIAGNGPAAAWGASASAWAPRPSAAARETQVADGQPFLIALAKAVEASKKGASASDSAAGAKK